MVWCGRRLVCVQKKGSAAFLKDFFFGWCCVRATERARRRHEDRLSGFTSTAVNFLSRNEPMRARERDRERLDRALAGPPLCVVLAAVNTTTRARAAPQKTKHKQAASLLASRPPRPQSYSSRACVCVCARKLAADRRGVGGGKGAAHQGRLLDRCGERACTLPLFPRTQLQNTHKLS